MKSNQTVKHIWGKRIALRTLCVTVAALLMLPLALTGGCVGKNDPTGGYNLPLSALRLWNGQADFVGMPMVAADHDTAWLANNWTSTFNIVFSPAAYAAEAVQGIEPIEADGQRYYVSEETGGGTVKRKIRFTDGDLFISVAANGDLSELEWLTPQTAKAIAKDPEQIPAKYRYVHDTASAQYRKDDTILTVTLQPEQGLNLNGSPWLLNGSDKTTPAGRLWGDYQWDNGTTCQVACEYGHLQFDTNPAEFPQLTPAVLDTVCDRLEAAGDDSVYRFRPMRSDSDTGEWSTYRLARTGDTLSLLDEDGKTLFSGENIEILPGVATVKDERGLRFCNLKTGADVNGEIYDKITYQIYPDDGINTDPMKIYRGGKCGLADPAGNTILAPENGYDEIHLDAHSYEECWPANRIQADDLWGMIDDTGKVIIQPEWQYIGMDVYEYPDTVFVYGGQRWSAITLSDSLVASEPEATTPPDWMVQQLSSPPDAERRAELFDFVNQTGLWYLPFFRAGEAPTDTADYIWMMFYAKKSSFTKQELETFMRDYFGITGEITHSGTKEMAYRDGVYTPAGGEYITNDYWLATEETVTAVDGKPVYTVLFEQYTPASENIPTAEQQAALTEQIKAGNTENFAFVREVQIVWTLSEDGSHPVFLSCVAKKGGEADWFYELMLDDPAFKFLTFDDAVGKNGKFTDETLIYYAQTRMENYDYENGNLPEDYNAVTEKYLGQTVKDFNNKLTELRDGRVYLRGGYSFDDTAFGVLKSLDYNTDTRKHTCEFYCVSVSDSFWEAGTTQWGKEYLLSGNFGAVTSPQQVRLIRMVFELKTDSEGDTWLRYDSVEVLQTPVTSMEVSPNP